MSGSLYDQAYVTDLKTMRSAMTTYMASNGPDALWKEYEIRNRRHRRMPVIEAIREINKMIKEALDSLDVASGPARNQAGFVRYPN